MIGIMKVGAVLCREWTERKGVGNMFILCSLLCDFEGGES